MQLIEVIGQRLDLGRAQEHFVSAIRLVSASLVLLLAGYLAITALRQVAYLPLLPQMTADFNRRLDATNPQHGQTFVVAGDRVDRVDVVLRLPEASSGVPMVVRLRSDGPNGVLLMERRIRLQGEGSWQVYAIALPGPLPEGTKKLYFELENQTAHTTMVEDRISKWDRLPGGVFYARREVEWDDQDMVLQVYARPDPTAMLKNPASIAERLFPTAAGPLLLLEVIAVLSFLVIVGNHAVQQRLPVRPSWQLRYATDALIAAGILWWVTRFLLGGTYGAPAHWV